MAPIISGFEFFLQKKTQNYVAIWKKFFQRVLKIFTSFFVQMKTEKQYFTNQKFFTPLTSFLPPFLHSSQAIFNKFQKIAYHVSYIWLKLRGKKLVSGVKNFWFVKCSFSVFFCTKNHLKCFKTRENMFSWK